MSVIDQHHIPRVSADAVFVERLPEVPQAGQQRVPVNNPEDKTVTNIRSLIGRVEKHTVTETTKFLSWIPVIGWIFGGLYRLVQYCLKSLALKELKVAVTQVKIDEQTSEDIKKIHGTALVLLHQDEIKVLDKEYSAHLRQPHIAFQTGVIRELIELISEPKEDGTKEYKSELFPVYFALARCPANQVDEMKATLAENVREQIKMNKVQALRLKLAELEEKIKGEPKILAFFSKTKNSAQAINRCIQTGMHFEARLLHEEIRTKLTEVFGDLLKDAKFKEERFPMYLAIARCPENQTDQLIARWNEMPKLPDADKIDKLKVEELRATLKILDKHPISLALLEEGTPTAILDKRIQHIVPYKVEIYEEYIVASLGMTLIDRNPFAPVFGAEWNSSQFKNVVFPYYLALARSPAEQTDNLMLKVPEEIRQQISKIKIEHVKNLLTQLETDVPLPGHLTLRTTAEYFNQAVLPNIKLCQGDVDPERFILEARMVSTIASVFGEQWNDPDFRTQIFPIYLQLAAYPMMTNSGVETDLQQEWFAALPPQCTQMIPKKHQIEVQKIQDLKVALSQFVTLPNLERKVLPKLIPHDSLQAGTSITGFMGAIFYFNQYWNDPRYQVGDSKPELFKRALALSCQDDVHETLDLVRGYMKLDPDQFSIQYNHWTQSPQVTTEDFFKSYSEDLKNRILAQPKYADMDKEKLLEMIVLSLNHDDDQQSIQATIDMIYDHYASNKDLFRQTFIAWRHALSEGKPINRTRFFELYQYIEKQWSEKPLLVGKEAMVRLAFDSDQEIIDHRINLISQYMGTYSAQFTAAFDNWKDRIKHGEGLDNTPKKFFKEFADSLAAPS